MSDGGDRAPTQVLAYRFQVMCPPPDDDIYQDENLYYTPAAAEQAGRLWIQKVFG